MMPTQRKAAIDRSGAAEGPELGSGPPAVGVGRACRAVGVRGIVLAVLIAGGLGTGWFAVRDRPDPDRLWNEAETAFLAGRWDRARALLRRLERLRPRTALDWLLEAQLATA